MLERATMCRRHRVLNALAAGLLLVAAPAAQQTPQSPVFRSSVDAVDVDVRVTGRNGETIRDLTPADFELRDNGEPQTITSASLVGVAPRSVSGTAAGPAIEVGRVYVLVLDDLQVNPRWTTRVRQLARQFVQRSMAPGDRMIVRVSGGGPAIAHQFTDDKERLFRAIDGFSGRKLPPASVEENDRRAVSQELRTWSSTNDPLARERALNARAMLSTLNEAARSLGDVPGRRKAIVLISEGIDYDITNVVGQVGGVSDADSIGQDLREAVATASRTNISIYTIDPRGLAQNTADTLSAGSLDRTASSALRTELLLSQSSLRELADTTGGLAAVNANDLAPFFARIVNDTSTYYLLSYSPGPDAKPGTFHKLDVRVKRSGARVRARRGYTSAVRVVTTAAAAAAPIVPLPATPPPAAVPDPAPTAEAPVPATAAPVVAAERGDPATPESLAVVLQRVAAYVLDYQTKFAGIVAEEHYFQEVRTVSGGNPGRTGLLTPNRELRSDVLLVKPAGEDLWFQFRDVFEVDRNPVRDRDERLHKLFVERTPGSLRQADRIQAESARYNIGPILRTQNVPILALLFLDQSNQSRFAYQRTRPGNTRAFAPMAAEADVWAIEFRETAPQTLIRTAANRDLPSRGRVWVDSTSGRILRTELIARDTEVSSEVTVNYRPEKGIDLLVPADMDERYVLSQVGIRVTGSARYSRIRQFTVLTTEKPKNE